MVGACGGGAARDEGARSSLRWWCRGNCAAVGGRHGQRDVGRRRARERMSQVKWTRLDERDAAPTDLEQLPRTGRHLLASALRSTFDRLPYSCMVVCCFRLDLSGACYFSLHSHFHPFFLRVFRCVLLGTMATLTDIKAVASAGIVVSLPHAAGMQSSLPILQKNYKFSKVFYWGKMMGMKGDYLIAKGIEESSSTMKFFYWCASREPAARADAQWRRPATAMVLSCGCRRHRWLPLLPVPAAFPVPVASSLSLPLLPPPPPPPPPPSPPPR